METLVPAAFLNQETAGRGSQTAVPLTRVRLRSAVCGLPSLFITCAVEIEGDTPLYSYVEGVDD
jgi:hypothetical protein